MNDHALFGDFVSPNICDSLGTLGLSFKTSYFWRVNHNASDCELITQFFDKDHYYAYGQKMICDANGSRVIPAYTTSNIERCLPAYLLNRNDKGEYELGLQAVWCNKIFNGKRLPDVMAQMLLMLLENKVLNTQSINPLIESLP